MNYSLHELDVIFSALASAQSFEVFSNRLIPGVGGGGQYLKINFEFMWLLPNSSSTLSRIEGFGIIYRWVRFAASEKCYQNFSP